MSSWVSPELRGTALGEALRAPQALLAVSGTRFVKDHRRTAVAAATIDGREVYVKRFKPHAWYRPLQWLVTGTPAQACARSAAALAAAGFRVPPPLAIAESRAAGLPSDCYFVSAAIEGSQPVGRFWHERAGTLSIRERAALFGALAAELSRFHEAGFYSRDANADNFLLRWHPPGAPEFFFLDLENVRHVGRVSQRRRVKNLVQLYRPVRGAVRRIDRLRFVRAYFAEPLRRRRDWLDDLVAFDEQKEREYGRRRLAARPP
jgi:hypothetical protein